MLFEVASRAGQAAGVAGQVARAWRGRQPAWRGRWRGRRVLGTRRLGC
jgi:hypothetical protein